MVRQVPELQGLMDLRSALTSLEPIEQRTLVSPAPGSHAPRPRRACCLAPRRGPFHGLKPRRTPGFRRSVVASSHGLGPKCTDPLRRPSLWWHFFEGRHESAVPRPSTKSRCPRGKALRCVSSPSASSSAQAPCNNCCNATVKKEPSSPVPMGVAGPVPSISQGASSCDVLSGNTRTRLGKSHRALQ